MSEAPILFPKGPVALAQRDLLFTALGLMMIVVIPVFVLTAIFVLRYRSGRVGARYTPNWGSSAAVEAVVWLVPAAIVVALGVLVWTWTHKLDPYKELPSDAAPFNVMVIAQDWKWLFLYPELGVATVNELVFPADRTLSLTITSDTVMNAFMVPALGGQIYAMAGMTTRLNLAADAPGTFRGRNTQYSGDGFSEQHFKAHAMTDDDFTAWHQKVQSEGTALNGQAYVDLAKPSTAHPVTYFSSYLPHLFHLILGKYSTMHGGTCEGEDAALICGEAS
ncbi:MAG: ubiquinol oxidase subunit II [Devosia sp.]